MTALKAGTRLGPYEIMAPIGAGGMGEVYRARDTRLDRTVAIKVLPAWAAGSSNRRQRLEREARTISQLSHPHICALYDVGHQDGIDYLVMEYLDGETLADRIRTGPLSMEQVLGYAAQIAAALAEAHRHGVTHRDLKPGNVMLTATGAKLLDFGLAKLDASPQASAVLSLTAMPTEDKPLTAEGTILGTLRYMAPEQLKDREADARTDIWALGLVIQEMATGESVFAGGSQAGIIAAILERDPPRLSTLRPDAPPALDRLVHRCLVKDPEERWQSARDLLVELNWIQEAGPGAEVSASATPTRSRTRERFLWAALATAVAAFLVLALVSLDRPMGGIAAARFTIPLPEHASASSVRVSPDGRFLSFIAEFDGKPQLWLRPLDSLSARPLPGTEGASVWGSHFWSPDGRFIGFTADWKLKKIDVGGGPPQVLADVPGSGPFQLGTWSRDGTILYNVVEAPGHDGLYRVSADGGPATRLTIRDDAGDEIQVHLPSFLPDGRHFLFTAPDGIWAGSVDSARAVKLLNTLSYSQYVPPGYLLYARDGALFAHPFDAGNLRFGGEPIRIAERVETFAGYGMPSFSASESGILVYYSGDTVQSRLIWTDRSGMEVRQVGEPAGYGGLRLSPDGNRLLVSRADPRRGSRDLWVVELTRDIATRFTADAVDVYGPVWSPGGDRVVFSKPVDGPPSLHHKPLAGGTEEVLLPSTGTALWANDWSQDGRFILYTDRNPETSWDIWILPLAGAREPVPFLRTRFMEGAAALSPDGRLVAFVSDESGAFEIYVRSLEGPGENRRISPAGGHTPRWRRDGRELFYLSSANQVMAVPVTLDGGFEPGRPAPLFTIDPGAGDEVVYDVSADGQRFIINSAMPGTRPAPTLVLDWTAELRATP